MRTLFAVPAAKGFLDGKYLKMAEITAIQTLHAKGHSNREIARLLGVNRETVGKYVNRLDSKPAKPGPRVRPGPKNACEPFRELILIKSGFTVVYRSIFDTVRDLLHDEAFDGHERIMAKYLKPDLLILDDMGMKQLPKRIGELLFEIIMRRHELRSTIMTSNLPLEDWGKLIGDVPAATAILDRFLQDAELIEITGNCYRLRNGRQSKAKPAIPDPRVS